MSTAPAPRRQRRSGQSILPQPDPLPPPDASPSPPAREPSGLIAPRRGGVYLLDETVRYFEEIAKRYKVSVATVHRWRLTGLKGQPLEAWLIGSRWITSEEACIRFFEAVNAVARGETVSTPAMRSARQRAAESARAGAIAAEMGA